MATQTLEAQTFQKFELIAGPTTMFEPRALDAMTIKDPASDHFRTPAIYDFAAVGIAIEGAALLHPSVASHTEEMHVNDSGDPKMAFSFTHEGVLTKMHQLAFRHRIPRVSDDDMAEGKNEVVSAAIVNTLAAIDRDEAELEAEQKLPPDVRFTKALAHVVPHLNGAFSFMALHGDKLFVGRDRHGIGSMYMGILPSEGHVVSSQAQSVEEYAQPAYEVETGTILCIGAKALHSTRWLFK